MIAKDIGTPQDLRGFFEFYEIPHKYWLKIFSLTERCEYEKGEIVEHAHLPCKHVHIVVDGFVKLMSPGVRDTLCLTIMAENSIWNEGTVFYQHPLPLMIIAGTHCCIYRIDAQAYRGLVSQENDLLGIMHRICVRRIAALSKHEFLFRYAGPVYRCLYVLCKFEKSLSVASKIGSSYGVKKSQLTGIDIETLSQIAGVTSAQFTSVVGKLKSFKLIQHTYSNWGFDGCAEVWAAVRGRIKSMNEADVHMDVVALEAFLNDLCAKSAQHEPPGGLAPQPPALTNR